MELRKNNYIRTENGWIGKIISDPYEFKDSMVVDIEFKDTIYNDYELDYEIVDEQEDPLYLLRVGDLIETIDFDDEPMITQIYDIRDVPLFELPDSPTKRIIDTLNDRVEDWEDIVSVITREQVRDICYKGGKEYVE